MTADFDGAQHAPEVQRNPGHDRKFVVMHNRHILAVDRERQALVERAAKEAGLAWQPLVVVFVPSPERWGVPR